MSKTIVERDFWNDEIVIDMFSPEDKLFMMYLMTCPRGNPVGIYKIPIKIMAFEIGYSPEAIRVLIDRFMNKYKKIYYDYEEQEIAILSTLKHTINRGGKPIEEMVAKKLEEATNLDLIIKVYNHMQSWWDLSTREIDKTIKKIFEDEIQKRESLISNNNNNYINTNTNTYTNTYTLSGTDSGGDSEEADYFNISKGLDKNYDSGTDSVSDSRSDSWKKEVIEAWNSLDKNIKEIKALNAGTDRYKLMQARINQYGLDEVLKAIKSIDESEFLKGYVKDFVITFDWFVRPNNFVKVWEGNYIDKKVSQESPQSKEISIAEKARMKRLERLNGR